MSNVLLCITYILIRTVAFVCANGHVSRTSWMALIASNYIKQHSPFVCLLLRGIVCRNRILQFTNQLRPLNATTVSLQIKSHMREYSTKVYYGGLYCVGMCMDVSRCTTVDSRNSEQRREWEMELYFVMVVLWLGVQYFLRKIYSKAESWIWSEIAEY